MTILQKYELLDTYFYLNEQRDNYMDLFTMFDEKKHYDESLRYAGAVLGFIQALGILGYGIGEDENGVTTILGKG